MGHKHTKEEILAGALAAAADDGLSQLTFGRLAKRLGISDRIVVYYFPTKADLVGEVIVAMGSSLQAALAELLTEPVADHRALARAVWPLVRQPETAPTFALFFEANGLAAVGREPYRTIVPLLVEEWVGWAAEHLTGDAERRRREAAAAIAIIDGLVLLRLVSSVEAADQAAVALGVA